MKMTTTVPPRGARTSASTEAPSTESSRNSALRKKEDELFRQMLRTTQPMAPDPEPQSDPSVETEEDSRDLWKRRYLAPHVLKARLARTLVSSPSPEPASKK